MLFTTSAFLLIFLPAVLAGHWLLRVQPRLQTVWLLLASIVFYGWNNPQLVALLLTSMLFNFGAAQAVLRHRHAGRWILGMAVTVNLAALGYFKYWNFFWANVGTVAGFDLHRDIALPLAISFFTFQQIAYVADCARGVVVERDFIKYGLFVTFFPHLIAGPLVHHAEMIPQFGKRRSPTRQRQDLSVGLSLFAVGLAKKVVFADWFAMIGDTGFGHAGSVVPSFAEAWGLALVFGLQIYFDFSGYTDMALGLARMFGIRLPENFASPYKAASIIEFWRRWHMTLSRFLRDYLYIPLGGNAKGMARRLLNLMVVMLLAGLWHGAGWGFVAWGALHGLMLTANHLLRALVPPPPTPSAWRRRLGISVTFLLVLLAWVPFRAGSLALTVKLWGAMLLAGGIGLPLTLRPALGPAASWLETLGMNFNGMFPNGLLGHSGHALGACLAALLVVWLGPNTAALFVGRRASAGGILAWRPNGAWATATGLCLALAVLGMRQPKYFVYFQF
ncbi:MAG: MBOAT family protein [Magnetospirillum sp.]|nr:MBOAT family protein [Magnetospirillum sp.]